MGVAALEGGKGGERERERESRSPAVKWEEGKTDDRLAGFTARAASAPDGFQSTRETVGFCSVLRILFSLSLSLLLARGSGCMVTGGRRRKGSET